MKKILVIGAGISGLCIAHRLKVDYGVEAIVLEAGSRAGGKIFTRVQNGFLCEESVNGWLDKEPEVRKTIKELNLSDSIIPCNAVAKRRFIYRKGALREIHMNPVKFMFSSALPPVARLRLLLEPFIPQSKSNEDETLASFAKRRLGRGARDFLISPMASGVFAGDPNLMSVRSCFPKVKRLEDNYKSLVRGMIALKKEMRKSGKDPKEIEAGPSGELTSFKNGMSTIIDALALELEGQIRTGQSVCDIKINSDKKYEIFTDNKDVFKADVVISAAPAWAASKYFENFDSVISSGLGEIEYPPLYVVSTGFNKQEIKHHLNGFGFLVPRRQGIRILGSLWTSSIFENRSPENTVLLRTMAGGMLDREIKNLTEIELVNIVRRNLKLAMGINSQIEPAVINTVRHIHAIPQYNTGHEELVAKITKAADHHKNLIIAGNYKGGIGVNDCIRSAAEITSSFNIV